MTIFFGITVLITRYECYIITLHLPRQSFEQVLL